jgi:hypothetical protein
VTTPAPEEKQSEWSEDKSFYTTPAGQRVRVANGHMLWISRHGQQQKAQAKRVRERGE